MPLVSMQFSLTYTNTSPDLQSILHYFSMSPLLLVDTPIKGPQTNL
jgi:hypothetical protein